jgi:23S rRNA U2552 (ribose-2'-O)-methylase RlmE/FtsJ
MKMANIDAITGFMFTDPRTENGAPLGPLEVLYFADICAGPGGFSEYVLWRKKWHAKGFGFTLKDPADGSDFKLDAFTSPCETFDPHYGVGGYNGDGDITRPDNQSEFRNYVIENTEGKGVHFVMADGGISVEGEENKQELLLKQLVLCQYATSLSILRPGGSCVVKVFDMFTLFSIGLFYLLYRCFHRIALFKPVTSRPANSERSFHSLSWNRMRHSPHTSLPSMTALDFTRSLIYKRSSTLSRTVHYRTTDRQIFAGGVFICGRYQTPHEPFTLHTRKQITYSLNNGSDCTALSQTLTTRQGWLLMFLVSGLTGFPR